jgi:hypothetical protein
MAARLRTVDHALVVVDGPIDAAGVYVPMVPVDPTSSDDAIDVLTDALSRRWIDEALRHLAPEDLGLEL